MIKITSYLLMLPTSPLPAMKAEIPCCSACFQSSTQHHWEAFPKPSQRRCSSQNEELENVTFDRQRVTRCKTCKVPVGRKKAKQRSGRKKFLTALTHGTYFSSSMHT